MPAEEGHAAASRVMVDVYSFLLADGLVPPLSGVTPARVCPPPARCGPTSITYIPAGTTALPVPSNVRSKGKLNPTPTPQPQPQPQLLDILACCISSWEKGVKGTALEKGAGKPVPGDALRDVAGAVDEEHPPRQRGEAFLELGARVGGTLKDAYSSLAVSMKRQGGGGGDGGGAVTSTSPSSVPSPAVRGAVGEGEGVEALLLVS